MSKLKTYLPWIACCLLIGGGLVYDFGPAVTLPDWAGWLSTSKTPAAWVVIVRDEATETHLQAEAWDSPTARKVMSDAQVQFRLLDPKQREAMPQAFWPWLEAAAKIKGDAGAILMADASGKLLDAQTAPQSEAEFLTLLHGKGKLP